VLSICGASLWVYPGEGPDLYLGFNVFSVLNDGVSFFFSVLIGLIDRHPFDGSLARPLQRTQYPQRDRPLGNLRCVFYKNYLIQLAYDSPLALDYFLNLKSQQ